jgi:HTH-type transcriptional regulator/antitoxin MqsA
MKCFACGQGKLLQRTKLLTYTYKGQSIELKQSGLWCDHCDEGILSDDDIKETELAFDEFKSKVDGLLPPKEIRRIRKDVLKITQEEAGRIFGGGKNAFGRYERGLTKPMAAVSNLLKMLEMHPEDKNFFLNKEVARQQPRH